MRCDQSSAANWSTVISTVRIIARRVPRSSVECALAIFQAKLDRFANILERFFASPSLADAARDNGTLGNDETVFAGYQDNG
jgi:hypothetical protein